MSYEGRPRFSIPIPGLQRPVGLGSAIARATQAVGIKPCTPCEQRKAALDRLVQLRRMGRR